MSKQSKKNVDLHLPWKIGRHSSIDKQFNIIDKNGDVVFTMDYDDVDHKEQDRKAREIVRILNVVNDIGVKMKKVLTESYGQ